MWLPLAWDSGTDSVASRLAARLEWFLQLNRAR